MYAGTTITSPGGLFTAEILSNGTVQPVYTGPDGYHWVAGEPGRTCAVRLRTRAGRIEAALSVDGRDALDDKPADLAASRGMVFTSEAVFTGFRIDDDRVREFTFGTVKGSVADQAGNAASVGVIGIAAWREQRAAWTTRGLGAWGGETIDCNVAVASTGVATRGLGMHAGETRQDPVGRTTFERDGSPDVLEIGYDTFAALEAMGITRTRPKAFPGRTTGYEAYRA